jgi:ferredoxin
MKPKSPQSDEISRRKFLKCTGTIIFAIGSSRYVMGGSQTKVGVSDGYLLVDIRKCQGCISCMLACSLVHEGLHSASLSRIQILQNPFKTRFYQFQGWDTKTGFPTRKALESLDLEGVADELEKNGKLGTATAPES